MKKKNVLAGVLAATMLNGTAFAEISVQNGVLDRDFSEDRTLYFVEIFDDEIPDVTADGYELVKKATVPYMGGALVTENATIIKNTETGVRYRFVFEKKDGSVDVENISLNTDGVLNITGTINGVDRINLLILKPTELFSESTFKVSDVKEDAMEETVLDAFEINKESVEGTNLIEYTFPSTAESGQYGFLISGEGIKDKYYSEIYYMSEADIQNIINDINVKSDFDDSNTVEMLRTYIEENSKRIYLDMSDYDKLSDNAKNKVIESLESDEDYSSLDDIGMAFYKGVSVAWIYDGLTPEEILTDNEYLTIEMFDNYLALKDKSDVKNAVKGIDNEEEIKSTFNREVSISMLNEAEPSDIKNIIVEYNKYIEIDKDLYDYFMKNTSKCIKALGNKDFDTVDEIEAAIKKVKNASSGGGGGNGGGGGIPSGGVSSSVPSANGGYIAPITEQKPVVTEKPQEEIKQENTLPFNDIDDVSWAHTAIKHLYNNKILNGKTENIFAPNDNIKREEFVKLVVNGFGLEGDGEAKFEDVLDGEWYVEFLNIAVGSEVVNGISETKFGVGEYITREDMAVMIYRAVKASGRNTDIIIENPAELTDLETVSDYAKEAVDFMIEKGAINGINGEFKPKNYATRAQTAQMLYQIIKIR